MNRTLFLLSLTAALPGIIFSTPTLACEDAKEINGKAQIAEYGKTENKAYKVNGKSSLTGRVGISGTLCLWVDGPSTVKLEGYAQRVEIHKLNGQSTIDLRNLTVQEQVNVLDAINGQSLLNVLLDKNAVMRIRALDGQSKVGFQFTKACEDDKSCMPTVDCGKVNGASVCSKGFK